MLNNLTLNLDKNITAKSALLLGAVAVVGVGAAAAKGAIDIYVHKAKARVDKSLAEDLVKLQEPAVIIEETEDN